MITIRHTLAIITMAFSFALNAQQQVFIMGGVLGAPGPVNVVLTITSDDGITNETVTITTDEFGGFSYTFGYTSDGVFTAGVMCGGLINDIQTFYWSSNALSIDVGLNYCNVNPTDCDAYFWCWNDSIAADSLDIDPYQVWIINDSQGSDLSYMWDFGDGSTSTEMYPTHEYTEVGTYTVCLYISSGDGCTDSYCYSFTVDENGVFDGGGAMQQGFTLNVVEEIVLGQEENELVNNLSVYPNPINETSVLSIQSTKAFNGTIELFNLQGQLVYSTSQFIQGGQNQITLNAGDLSSGNYLLKLKNENGQAESIMLTK